MGTVSVETSVVAELMASAVAFSAQKLGLSGEDEVLAALRRGDRVVSGRVQDGLALALAEYLGTTDDTVRAVYVYDPEYATESEEAIPSSGLDLLVRVSRRSAALDSLVHGLVLALAGEQRRMLGLPTGDLCFALDVQIVEDAAVRARTGYGALVQSVQVRPTEVWRR